MRFLQKLSPSYSSGSAFSRFSRSLLFISIFISAIALTLFLSPNPNLPASAQIQSDLLNLNWLKGDRLINKTDDSSDHAEVKLDGYRLFILTAPSTNQRFPLEERVKGIETELERIANSNFDPKDLQIVVNPDPQNGQPVININDRYLMTVTALDAQLQGRDPQGWANQLVQTIRDALGRSHRERQTSFLINQGLIAVGILAAMLLTLRLLQRWKKKLKIQREAIANAILQESLSINQGNPPLQSGNAESGNAESRNTEINNSLDLVQVDSIASTQISDQNAAPNFAIPLNLQNSFFTLKHHFSQKQLLNLKDLQKRFLQLGEIIIIVGGIFIILGLFPYTRWLQAFILSTPLQIVAIALIAYLLARVSDLLIERFAIFLKERDLTIFTSDQRVDLRVSTVSRVLKNVSVLFWLSLGLVTVLSAIGVDLIPLLAGAGIVGLAISFAAQGLIKDVINGFLIILEDQYAVGDVINIGNVGGLVENMNLRITQVRNGEGQLITIPNSSITIVQNLSKEWARVDLAVRVAYETDPNWALAILQQVANEMYQDEAWRSRILEEPEVLGIDELQHTGMLIRIWIKTQPLQQWAVGREFRRRLRLRMEQEGIEIGVPQQSISLPNFSQK